MKVSTFSIILLFLISCSDFQKPKQLDQIVSMQHSVDSLLDLVPETAFKDLSSNFDTINAINQRLSNQFTGDTINLDLAEKLESFRVMRLNLSIFLEKYPAMLNHLQEFKTSLAHLKSDIENDAGKRDRYAEYLRDESDKLDEIKLKMDTLIVMKNRAIDTYHDLFSELVPMISDTVENNPVLNQ